MSSTKVVIIVLVVIAALFVVLMIWGANNNSDQSSLQSPSNSNQSCSQSPSNSNQSCSQSPSDAAKSFKSKPHSFLSSLSNLSNRLGYGPKIDVKQLQPQLKTFDLAKQAKYQVKVLADSDNAFRRAAIKVQPVSKPLCAHVSFTPETVDGLSADLTTTQSSDDPKVDPNDFKLTIPKGGGELVVESRSPNKPCMVTLE